jgi:hypothetical protein
MAVQDFSDALASGNWVEGMDMLVAIRKFDASRLTRQAYLRTVSTLVNAWAQWPYTRSWPDEYLAPHLRGDRTMEDQDA